MIKGYIQHLVEGICLNSKIIVTEEEDTLGTLFTVSGISKADMKNLIGKGGAHIMALRTLVRVMGGVRGIRASVKLEEPQGYDTL